MLDCDHSVQIDRTSMTLTLKYNPMPHTIQYSPDPQTSPRRMISTRRRLRATTQWLHLIRLANDTCRQIGPIYIFIASGSLFA